MCKDGIFRSKENLSEGLGTNAFSTLYCINDESVVKRKTTVIRESLPQGTQKHYLSKSLREDTMNIMSSKHSHATVNPHMIQVLERCSKFHTKSMLEMTHFLRVQDISTVLETTQQL